MSQTDKHKQQILKNKQDESPVEETKAETVVGDNDDDVASAEEMEAFIKSRREKRDKERQHKASDESYNGSDSDTSASENAMDPYLEPDPTLPRVKYTETPLLWRGCSQRPESYVPVSDVETRSCAKVCSCNWMKGIRQPMSKPFDCVEVRFKNNRKDFYRLPDGINVTEGDVVAVEGMPGHDVGIVSLTGEACRIQMKKKKVDHESESIKRLFRRAKANDIEHWLQAIKEEENTLVKTRQIADDIGLVMKVNDIEYQGDNSKAIFYYTADDRVDFRTLIKVLAEQFKVRVEMKQIGVRQEAGKVGGIGTCGRELCCSTWLTNFKSVTTGVAKAQQILPNPQKLAGQCGKLKCCLNFEYEVYTDALKKFPPANTPLRFKKGLALYKKTDVFRGIMWYAYEGDNELYAITAENVKKIIEMNRERQYPEKMEDYQEELMSTAALEQESTTAEFEQELHRLSDDGGNNGIVEEHKEPQERNNRAQRGGRDHRDNRDHRQREGGRERQNGGNSAGTERQQRSPEQRKENQYTPRDRHRQSHDGRNRDRQRRNPDSTR